VSPLNGRTAIKVDRGEWGYNSGAKDKIPEPKGKENFREEIYKKFSVSRKQTK